MDSGNILSVLNFLQGQQAQQPPGADAPDVQLPSAANNVLQAAAPQQPPPPQIPTPPQVVPPQAVAQAAVAASAPMPKPRHSLADIIGHIADGLAQAGGATPMYQRTIDAMQEHATKVDMDKLDLATKQLALTTGQNTYADSERTRFGHVLGAVNDAADAAALPQLMAANGLTDPKYAPFIKMVQDDPDQAKVLAAALGEGGDDKLKYSGNVIYAKDAAGNLHAFQANQSGGDARDVLPKGFTPVDPMQFVNTGGAQVGVGKLSGTPKTILPNTVSPNTVATTTTQRDIAAANNTSREKIANMPARAKAASANGSNAGFTAYTEARNGLTDLSHQLDAIINDPGLMHATGPLGMVERHIPGTPAQRVMGNITTAKGQALSAAIQNLKALSATGNLGFRLTQQEANAFGAKMAGALENTNQNATDYAANLRAAQGRLQSMISRLDQDAVRNKYVPTNLPTLSPADAAKLAPGTSFRTLDGRVLVRH